MVSIVSNKPSLVSWYCFDFVTAHFSFSASLLTANLWFCSQVSKLEAGQQDQQVLALEDYGNASPRVLLTKLANVVVAILAVVLVFVSTISNTLGPFLSTRFVPNPFHSQRDSVCSFISCAAEKWKHIYIFQLQEFALKISISECAVFETYYYITSATHPWYQIFLCIEVLPNVLNIPRKILLPRYVNQCSVSPLALTGGALSEPSSVVSSSSIYGNGET